ncbi:MAG: hypothetical protein ACLFUS_10810 [Candidatus Sumerlaeia bacterium]
MLCLQKMLDVIPGGKVPFSFKLNNQPAEIKFSHDRPKRRQENKHDYIFTVENAPLSIVMETTFKPERELLTFQLRFVAEGAVRDRIGDVRILDLDGLDVDSLRGWEALTEATGMEAHGMTFADYSVFEKAKEPTHAQNNEDPLVDPETVDLRPAADSPFIDAGIVIPNINEDFTGDAPDLGAFERGGKPIHFGPRSK